MKKLLCLLIAISVYFGLFASLEFTVFAETETIYVYNQSGEIISSFDVDVDDAQKQIQKAFNFINECNDGNIYTVKLPQNNYVIKTPLDIFSNTVFDLNGSVIKRGTDDKSSLLRFGRADVEYYGYDAFENITIKNGTFDSANIGTSSLIRFAHAKNIKLYNLNFQNTKNTLHMISMGACDGVVINKCGFYNADSTGINERSNAEALQIDILHERHFSYPAQDATPTKNVSVTECTFKNVIRGIGTHSAVSGHYFYNINVSNNYFENIVGYAVKATNYRNSKFNNNTVKNCGGGIFVGNMTNTNCGNFYAPFNKNDKIYKDANVQINNNSISIIDTGFANEHYGIYVFGKNVKSQTDKDNNTYSGDFRINRITVSNNYITSNVSKSGYNAMVLSGFYGKKTDNKIVSNKLYYNGVKSNKYVCGFRISDSVGLLIKSNTVKGISNKLYKTIAHVTNSKSIEMSYNTFANTSSFGVKFDYVSSSDFYKNTITNTGDNLIYVYQGCKNLSVISNKVSNSKTYGIVVFDASGEKISNNIVSNVKQHGIYFKGKAKYTSVSSNYIYNVTGNGIYFNASAYARSISNNIVDISSKQSGIYVYDKASVEYIKNNVINYKQKTASKNIKAKAYNGIAIKSKNCKIKLISGNKIKNATYVGIAVYSSATTPVIEKNTINSCNYGIRYSKAKVKNNKIVNVKTEKIKKFS